MYRLMKKSFWSHSLMQGSGSQKHLNGLIKNSRNRLNMRLLFLSRQGNCRDTNWRPHELACNNCHTKSSVWTRMVFSKQPRFKHTQEYVIFCIYSIGIALQKYFSYWCLSEAFMKYCKSDKPLYLLYKMSMTSSIKSKNRHVFHKLSCISNAHIWYGCHLITVWNTV